MCLWKDNNRPKSKRCNHGHRHHEVLYNLVIPSETPIVWCNAPGCWTVCSYGENPKVQRGLRAMIYDFFCTSDAHMESSQEWYTEMPSIQRGQTFAEFNKVRYPGYSPSRPSALETPAKTTKSSYFPDQKTILDIRAEKPKSDNHNNSRTALGAQDRPSYQSYSSEPLSSRAQRQDVAVNPRQHAMMQSGPDHATYSPTTRSRSEHSEYSRPAMTTPAHSDYWSYGQTSLYQNDAGGHADYSTYPYSAIHTQPSGPYQGNRQYAPSMKTDQSQPFSYPAREQSLNYPSQTPEHYGTYDRIAGSPAGATYSQATDPNPGSSSMYPTTTRIHLAQKKQSTSRSPQTKPQPAYSEYSPDIQALLGAQAAGRYPSYSPYGITRRKF